MNCKYLSAPDSFCAFTHRRSFILSAFGLSCLLAFCPSFASLSQAAEEENKIPEPENITLDTKEPIPLQLKCTWYAGTKGPKTVPIIMLHGQGGNRNDYAPLALYLQQQGHAVLVPDLRGHGGSTRWKGGMAPEKKKGVEVTTEDLQENYLPMIDSDIQACSDFLLKQNDDKQLNIDLLCVIASDMSTVLALNWAVKDWLAPAGAAFRDGQNVKALILLSPEDKVVDKLYPPSKVISTIGPLKHPVIQGKGTAVRLSLLIAVGTEDRKYNSLARSMHTGLKAYRKEPELRDQPGATLADKEVALKKEIEKNQDLFFDPYETSLQGTKLLDPKLRLGIEKRISNFIVRRLVAKESDYPWQERKRPF